MTKRSTLELRQSLFLNKLRQRLVCHEAVDISINDAACQSADDGPRIFLNCSQTVFDENSVVKRRSQCPGPHSTFEVHLHNYLITCCMSGKG